MIPWYFVALWCAMCVVIGWAASTFNFLHLRSKYDAAAEGVENLTAEEAQSLSDIFGSIAKRLKAPGK